MNLEKEIFDIDLEDVMPNRFQPREIFEDETLHELSESIKQHGVIQPIIVRKVGDKYEIIAGERRFRASQLAGKKTIPALVRDIDDREAAKIALLENLQRKDLTPIEEAKTYQTILKIDNITQEELAKNLGKSQSAIANKLRLLNLDEEVQTALLNNKISERHARSLLNLAMSKQPGLLKRIIDERMTVKQVDDEIDRINNKSGSDRIEENLIVRDEEPEIDIESIRKAQEPKKPTEIPKAIFDTEEEKEESEDEPEEPEFKLPPRDEEKPSFELPHLEEEKEPEKEENIIENNNIEYSNSFIPLEESPEKDDSEYIKPNNNIFDRLRIPADSEEEKEEKKDFNPDLRFAINNFRQAIQNTEKFGFKVHHVEEEADDFYKITITIDK